jgi:hypothetical protein
MKQKTKFICVFALLLLLMNVRIQAQSEFQVEFYKSKGELQKSDLYKKDFGRYKGFEIPANKGEAGSFVVYSPKFKPSLILTDEKGNVIKQVPGRDEHTAILSAMFPKSGNYVLFMVADSAARGEYDFHYGFASENSLSLTMGADFKKGIDYLLEHAKAYYLFFENAVEGKNSFYKIEHSTEVNIGADGSYNAVFYKGNELDAAQNIFWELTAKLSTSFDSNWKKELSEWQQNKNIREKCLLFTEKPGGEGRTVKVSMFDFSKARDAYNFSYGVSLIISKEH